MKKRFIVPQGILENILNEEDSSADNRPLFETKANETRYLIYNDEIAVKITGDSEGNLSAQAHDELGIREFNHIFTEVFNPNTTIRFISEKEFRGETGL